LSKKTLHLLIPGLLGPWQDIRQQDLPELKVPALERLLSRATRQRLDVIGSDATLFSLFGLPVPDARDLPVAAVTRLADGSDPGSDWWLRADPVHLCADRWKVLLFDARNLNISSAEAGSLTAQFNETFAADGWFLEALRPQRWYLRGKEDPGLRTYPLAEVIRCDIKPFLPTGATARHWRSLLTETQMLFHGATVNAEREARGLPAINSVWFWGGGHLPQGARSSGQGLYANDALTRGLAQLARVPVNPLPENAAEWYHASKAEAATLVVLEVTRFDQADDNILAWVEHVNALEQNWFAACEEMLTDKLLDTLYLYPCTCQPYEITSRRLRHFWQRKQPFLSHCHT
jgi:hypothetical protein